MEKYQACLVLYATANTFAAHINELSNNSNSDPLTKYSKLVPIDKVCIVSR